MADVTVTAPLDVPDARRSGLGYFIRRNPTLVLGLVVLAAFLGIAPTNAREIAAASYLYVE